MKKLTCLLLVTILTFTACKKDKNTDGTVIGKWKSTEQMLDIGNGNAKWKSIPKSERKRITFLADGTITDDDSLKSYTIKENNTMEVKTKNDMLITMRYELKGSTLILANGNCIEACAVKFEKTN